eukprot:TRINITY_DN452_c0_g2_i3.p1 TRINITY_DN452_c0_g2~~TRINITY_DN452_c0_g2_i3.p1  ORF type:complete len:155 (-),score=38.71 TRINITY_DN452_c0_g2_i3:125-589(-)
MVIAQLFMLEICVRLKKSDYLTNKKPFLEDPFSLSNFWSWDDFSSYLAFLGLFASTLLLLSGVFGMGSSFYWEVLGTIALATESILGVPQMINNQKTKSTKGLSLELIGSWLLGDVFKTVYFVAKGSPFQFLLCGTIQVVVDIIICVQIYHFKK